MRSSRSLRTPGLARAFAACRAGEADAALVSRLDRLTSSAAGLARLVVEAARDGIGLPAPDVGLDLATAARGARLPAPPRSLAGAREARHHGR